jgi:hypothetical protein
MRQETQTAPLTAFEMIDCAELGKRWGLPASWVKEQTRSRAVDPLPCVRFGKYVRFAWGSPDLADWLARHYKH